MTGSTQHFRTCTLCEAMCGIVITHDDGKIQSIKGDAADPHSKGFICPKATALQDLHDDQDRLRYPLLKTPHGWERISWENAFNEAAARLRNIQAKHGQNAVATYVGNPTVHNLGSMLTLPMFLGALKTESRYSATSLDQLSHMLVSLKLFGNQAMLPVPDIDRTDFMLCIGANPMASNGSVMSAPGFKDRIKALHARGGKLVVIDPRKTETAELADQHHFIRPGTDALLLMAMIHTLFRKDLVNLGNAQSYVQGVNFLRNMVTEFTPEKVASKVGISASTIRQLTVSFAAAPKAVVYCRMGTSTQAFGTLATWLACVLNILTGRLDAEGGFMFTQPAIDLAGLAGLGGLTGTFDTRKSRVRQLPEFGGEYPVATLADEMLTEGNGQIRALVTCAGNPVLSAPNGPKMEKALENLDFMVCIDFYLNETTRHADIILPPTGPLEHGHFDIALNAVAVRNVAKYSPPLYQPLPDTRHDWQIFLELTRRLETRGPLAWAAAEAKFQILKSMQPEGMIDLMLRTGPYGQEIPAFKELQQKLVDLMYDRLPARSAAKLALDISPLGKGSAGRMHGLSLDHLKRHPHGVDLGALTPCLPDKLFTEGKQINIVPKVFVKDVARLQKLLEKTPNRSPETFSLIGRRHIRSNNSWLHNSYRLVKGKNRCTAQIHPDDAKRLKIEDGDNINVSSKVGEIQIPVEITEAIMPRVISIPHGWGHHRTDTRIEVAQAHAGVSVNDITDDTFIDELTGVIAYSGLLVTVSKVKAGDNIVRINDRRLEVGEKA